MNVADVLDRAADLIEKDGWAQGGYAGGGYKREGANTSCAATAIDEATEFSSFSINAHRLLVEALGGDDICAIFRWNDAPGRTKAEVIAMLRACAMTERARAARLLQVVRETVNA